MNISFEEDVRQQIFEEIYGVLYKTLSYGGQEPELVASFIWNIVDAFDEFSNGSMCFHVGGVFIHQQPKVTCRSFVGSSPQSVELGDLLLLRTYIEDDCVIERRAFLLQAKKIKRVSIITPDNEKQHRLYAEWPEFTYVRSTKNLNGQIRHIVEANMYDAAKYLLIHENEECPCVVCPLVKAKCFFHYLMLHKKCSLCGTMISAKPSFPHLSHYYCFATELLEFITGYAGKRFNERVDSDDIGWSRVIHDLLETTANQRSKLMWRRGGERSMRGSGFVSGTMHRQSMLRGIGYVSNNDTNDYDNQMGDQSPDEGGMSILEFSIHATTSKEN